MVMFVGAGIPVSGDEFQSIFGVSGKRFAHQTDQNRTQRVRTKKSDIMVVSVG